MNVYLSSSFKRAYKKLVRKNPQLIPEIKEKIVLFKSNSADQSLKLHKLTGGLRKNWSFSITKDIRIVLSYSKDGVILVDIGKHEEVY